MMKKIRKLLGFVCVLALLVCSAPAAFASEALLDSLFEVLNEFLGAEDVTEIPVNPMSIVCGKERKSGLMLDDMVVNVYDWKREWTCDPYWAGEWTIFRIGEMSMLCRFIEENENSMNARISNLPIDMEKYDALSKRCGGNTNVVGIDSAYMHGEMSTSRGAGFWEAYPFVILDSDDSIYEYAAYLNFRIVIPVDEETDQIQDFIIASQDKVAAVYKRILELNYDIDENARNMMTAFVEYAGMIARAEGEASSAAGELLPAADTAEFVCGDYTAIDYGNGTCAITRYDGSAQDLVIPQELNGLKVVSITGLKMYSSPAGETVRTITIPEGVESLGRALFDGAQKRITIHIPASVKQISPQLFEANGSGISKSVSISKNNPTFEYVDGYLLDRQQKKLVAYWGSAEKIMIPNGVRVIGEYAFANNDTMTSATIPQSVTSIGEGAFMACIGLEEITIPEGVTSIHDDAFAACERLRAIRGSAGSEAERIARVSGVSFVGKDEPLPYQPQIARIAKDVYLRVEPCGGNLRKLKQNEMVTILSWLEDEDGDLWCWLVVNETGESGYLRDYSVVVY